MSARIDQAILVYVAVSMLAYFAILAAHLLGAV